MAEIQKAVEDYYTCSGSVVVSQKGVSRGGSVAENQIQEAIHGVEKTCGGSVVVNQIQKAMVHGLGVED